MRHLFEVLVEKIAHVLSEALAAVILGGGFVFVVGLIAHWIEVAVKG